MISDNLSQVKQAIADSAELAGRRAQDVRLIAVSKTRSLEEVRQALDAGQVDFGENTVQDAMTKIPLLQDTPASWHFIGHLQSKKAKQIPGHFQWLHSVDSEKLASKLTNAVTSTAGRPLNCLIQVNLSGETSKSGLAVDEIDRFLETVLTTGSGAINWRGLMTMGVRDDADATRRIFAACRECQQRLADAFELPGFDQLSMGMSGDYLAAIEEGSTMVRVGTAIFGDRR